MEASPKTRKSSGLRADAVRNEERLVEAAKRVFARRGVDAPVREIAEEAGLGLGTLYRRFPNRADLIASVFRREVDACVEAAVVLSSEKPAMEALEAWLKRYVEFLGKKQGLAAALHSGDPAFAALPRYFRDRFEPALASLLENAVEAGKARSDIEAFDLLRGIGNLAVTRGDDGLAHTFRMLALLLDGLRIRS